MGIPPVVSPSSSARGAGDSEVTKLRILACAYTCSPGGTSERFGGGEDILGWNLVKQLGRFHQVWVLAHTQNRPAIESALSHQPDPNLQFVYIDLPRWLRPLQQMQGGIQFYAYLWQIRAYFTALKLHRRLGFQVFQHITYANDWMASFIGALLPIPFIRGPGGGAHRTPPAFLQEYSVAGRIWERIRVLGQWVLRRDPFFLLGQNRALAILVCNREALEALPAKWREKSHLFPVNGVSGPDLASLPSEKPPSGRFRVLSAGKLLRIKGFGLAIRSFKIFADRHPQTEFTIVGDGPELPQLENLVRHLGLDEHVIMAGWMERTDLLAKMAADDVFLFASLRDGGGAVVVEAMSMGTPLICLDIGGPGMHVTDDCGIKIKPVSPKQSVEDLAAALERLYTDSDLRHDLGHGARRRTELVYHWDRLGERLLDLYRQVPIANVDAQTCINSGS